MTDFIKKSELENKWYHIDATNAVVVDWLQKLQKF